jgi:hypothetical protein
MADDMFMGAVSRECCERALRGWNRITLCRL